MSLINRQMLVQAKSDRDDCLRRLSIGEDTPRLRELLSGVTKRIAKLEKDIAQEEAKAIADRKAALENAKDKGKKAAGGGYERNQKSKGDRPPLPEDQELPCVGCGSAFTFTGKDQVFFEKQGWSQPSRCSDCREAKKTAKPTGTDLTCADCESTFFFSDAKASIFEEKGWEQPKRCNDCSVNHKSMVPLVIKCEGCPKDFSFSVKAQKDFKGKGWSAPKRCFECLRAKHEKKDTASVKSASQKA